jgi:hypothetical protein
MSFVHGQEYRPGHVWSTDDLLSVTPDILVRYIKMKVYGSENAQPDIDPPLYYRSNSVAYWKKAWSYFMPNQITPWNEIAAVGNPTRSTAVNKILKAMKKWRLHGSANLHKLGGHSDLWNTSRSLKSSVPTLVNLVFG